MSELEKMQRYIERTKLPGGPASPYGICLREMDEIRNFAQADEFYALLLLFKYGKAKGYRAAKAEMAKSTKT